MTEVILSDALTTRLSNTIISTLKSIGIGIDPNIFYHTRLPYDPLEDDFVWQLTVRYEIEWIRPNNTRLFPSTYIVIKSNFHDLEAVDQDIFIQAMRAVLHGTLDLMGAKENKND